MLALRELQAAFANHLIAGDRPDLAAMVSSGRIPAGARLEVHRHHLRQSLGAALAVSFPTVRALVGPDFFGRMTSDFVRQCLPSRPVLAEYGQDFASFIAGYEPAGGLPYLSDSARLDWALNLAFHAPLEPRLAAADLADVPVERLPAMSVQLASGTSVMKSAYPLDLIWRASQPGAAAGT